MIISRKWLEEYIDISGMSNEELDKLLSLSGSSVETVEYPWQGMENLTAGKITEIVKHPEADRLLICTVNTGDSVRKILTADSSVRVGETVPLALDGTVLFNGKKIVRTEMKGVMSEGMMCSLEEMGLEEKSPTIYKLPGDVEAGKKLSGYFGLDDSVFDLEITSNRPDELSFLGVAREIRALTFGEKGVNLPENDCSVSGFDSSEYADVRISNSKNCKRYTALVLKGVKVGPSPLWLRRHLVSVGLRPINNIVDVTNFVLMETGHPVHAFDLNKIADGRVDIRDSAEGEKLVLLDGTEITFEGGELLICDGEKPLALAGIMGGEFSGVTEATEDILLEVAFFDPVKIRATSKKLNVSSDSSYRFERGVNPEDGVWVAKRLAYLIQKLTGCEVAKSVIDVYPVEFETKIVELRKEKVDSKLGIDVKKEIIENILVNLDFEITSYDEQAQIWKVAVPVFRFDIEREVDLIEEIGRINGYDKVPSVMPVLSKLGNGRSSEQIFRYSVREKTLALGYNEISPLSFIDPADFDKFGISETHNWRKSSIELLKPLSKDISLMRASQVITLVKTMSYNYTRQISDLKFFEMGIGFKKAGNGYEETDYLTFGAIGRNNPGNYFDKTNVSFFTMKGDVEELLHSLGIKHQAVDFERIPENDDFKDIFYVSRAARITVEGKTVGTFGMVRNGITESYDIKSELYICEIDLSSLLQVSKENLREWLSVSGTNYPASRKDFSVLVPKGKEVGTVITRIRKLDLVEQSSIIDIYKGKNIPENHVSITISTVIRSADHTLSESELNSVIESIRQILQSENLELREG